MTSASGSAAATPAVATHQVSSSSSSISSSATTTSLSAAAAAASRLARQAEKFSFHLKTGIFTRRVTIDSDKMALGLIKQLAIGFVNEIYFQQAYATGTYVGDYLLKNFATQEALNNLYERLILRLYDPRTETFVPFNSVSDIDYDAFVCIELSEKQRSSLAHVAACHTSTGQASTLTALTVATSDTPATTTTTTSLTNSASITTTTTTTTSRATNSNNTCNSSSTSSNVCASASAASVSAAAAAIANSQVKMSHEFKPESFLFPTHCASCSTLIKGVFRQGFQCAACKRNFCPKCKAKADANGESCLVSGGGGNSAQSTAAAAAALHSDAAQSNSTSQILSAQDASEEDAAAATRNELAPPHANMTKRKSASNLLHFNIANPFKSHQQQQQATLQSSARTTAELLASQTKPAHPAAGHKVTRGSTGALEPVLQQISKTRDNTQKQQQQQQLDNSSLLNKPVNSQMSSSHHNLFATTNASTLLAQQNNNNNNNSGDAILSSSSSASNRLLAGSDLPLSSSNSAQQSPIGGAYIKHVGAELGGPARASAVDISRAQNQQQQLGGQFTRQAHLRDPVHHAFISMDWIQVGDAELCGACNKPLRASAAAAGASATSAQHAPFMCKNCKLQAHNQCQRLVLADCLTRIAESSRAAADEQQQQQQQQQEPKSPDANAARANVCNSSSNASRDNIRLHRLAPSVKHLKRPDSTTPIIEGWLKHTTLSDEQARQHYWRLDDTDITLYENDTSKRYFKAIALTKITRVMSAQSLPKRVREDMLMQQQQQQQQAEQQQQQQQQKSRSATTSPVKSPELLAQMNAMFAFELATGSMYLVQAQSEHEANRWRETLASATAKTRQSPASSAPAKDEQPAAATAAAATPQAAPTAPPPSSSSSVAQPPEKATCTAAEQSEADRKSGTKAAAETAAVALAKVDAQQQQQLQPKCAQATATAIATARPKEQQQQQQRQHHHYHHHHHRGAKSFTDPSRSRLYNRPRITIKLEPMAVPDHYIEGKYLIEPSRTQGKGFEELGSGQFGKVYAAISEIKSEDPSRGLWSGVPVAIKEISKARFDWRQQAKLKNEANILSRLDHPGVIILERVHDLPNKVYIVMEQLEDDMLEMIMSSEDKRLSERVTKFLTYQILEALKYLHAQNIAHCDLKPENVLLVERRSQFPQIKLCDFGFAKIIEENSFRISLVGTPAYLAPEVVKGERYNRSVDLWSVGVIVYVSLSGEFPFNEGENIHDQISRANFMYPDVPWAKVSQQAKAFINSLLRVNSEKRLSASRAQMEVWIQDYQLWCDLCELEVRVGRRWVTDDADFERWTRYARERNLQVPRSAIQLHEDLRAAD